MAAFSSAAACFSYLKKHRVIRDRGNDNLKKACSSERGLGSVYPMDLEPSSNLSLHSCDSDFEKACSRDMNVSGCVRSRDLSPSSSANSTEHSCDFEKACSRDRNVSGCVRSMDLSRSSSANSSEHSCDFEKACSRDRNVSGCVRSMDLSRSSSANSSEHSCDRDFEKACSRDRNVSGSVHSRDLSRSSSANSSEQSWVPTSADWSSSDENIRGRTRQRKLRKRMRRQSGRSRLSSSSPSKSPVYSSRHGTSSVHSTTVCEPANKLCELPSANLYSCVSETDDSTQDTNAFPALSKNVTSTSLMEGKACENSKDRNMGGKSKTHCCLFCQKFNTKMSTHLQRRHKDELEVAKILALKKGDPVRRQSFIHLQDQGDFNHNCRVLRGKDGHLIAKYRQKKGLKAQSEYLACPHCKGLYLKTLLFKHERRCSQKPEGAVCLKRGQCTRLGRLMLPLPKGISAAFFEKVIGRMKEDNITRLVKTDDLILKYGHRLFSRRDVEEHSSSQISGRLRELGRLVNVLRTKTNCHVSTLSQAIDPSNFDDLLVAVRELGEFSHETNMCKKGSLVQKVGYSLKKCCQILKADGIKVDDVDVVRKCDQFVALFEGDWYDHISACASQSVQRARMNRPRLLPLLGDVEKVNQLVLKKLEADTYPVLAKAVLASIMIFNRKRGGEVQRMKCDDYFMGRKSSQSQPEEEVLKCLTPTEKKLVSILQRLEIRGKFNRPVPVLLTPAMISGIEKLLALRLLMGIDSAYLFISQTGERPYRGSSVLKELAEEAEVSEPALFTATSLRKQLATLSQALEISQNNQDHLATFLGHDIRVHRNIYCQTLDITQKAKVASILLKVNAGLDVVSSCLENLQDEEIVEQSDDEGNSDSEPEYHDSLPSACPSHVNNEKSNKLLSSFQNTEVSTSVGQCEGSAVVSQSYPKTKPKKFQQKRPWTEEEAAAVRRHFANFLILNKVPGKYECERALAAEPVLCKRKWKDVKYFVYNQLKKANKK